MFSDALQEIIFAEARRVIGPVPDIDRNTMKVLREVAFAAVAEQQLHMRVRKRRSDAKVCQNPILGNVARPSRFFVRWTHGSVCSIPLVLRSSLTIAGTLSTSGRVAWMMRICGKKWCVPTTSW